MALVFAAVGGLVWLFVRIQRRAPMPTIPLELFRERMFVLGAIASFAFGWVAFTLTAFVPMFVQGVIGGGARAAGIAVLAQSLAWSVAAAAGGPLVRPLGYRRMNLLGFGLVLLGYLGLLRLGPGSPLVEVLVPMVVMGLGNGACSVSQLLAAQNSVEPRFLGVATSLAMFFRNVGFAVGVSVLGAVQVGRLAERNGGVLPDTTGLLLGEAAEPGLQAALAGSVHDAWTVSLLFLLLGLAAASQMTAWRVVGASSARSAAGAAGD